MTATEECRGGLRLFSYLLMIFILTFATSMLAQTDTARLRGTVTDIQGAAIAGATVDVTNVATGRTISQSTDSSGSYIVSALPPGKYHIQVKQHDFKTAVADITLEVSQVQSATFKLEPGSVETTVNVTDEIPLVETGTSSTGEVIQGRQVTELPLNGRNFTQLALLTPGVTRGAYGDVSMGGTGGTGSEGYRYSDTGGASLSVNGLRAQANNYILDGLDNNESLVNTIVYFPPVEAIQEFRVNTSVAPAEFGRAGGAVVQTQIKSGSNDIHGSAFWFRQSGEFNAHAYNNPDNTYRRNQFGATLGGPIVKNKLFAFLDYQGLRQNLPQSDGPTWVPTALMRQGNFSELIGSSGMTTVPVQQICPNLYVPGSVLSVNHGYVFDPQTCLPFGWVGDSVTGHAGPNINIIPTTSQNAVGMALVNAYPLPNISGVAINAGNFLPSRHQIRNYDDSDARIDWVASEKDSVFVRGSYGQEVMSVSDLLKDATHDLPSGFGSGYNPTHPRSIATGYTHTFSPELINEFRFGYTRDLYGYSQPGYGNPEAEAMGIPNANRNSLLGGMPLIGGWGSAKQLEYTGDGGPYSVPQKTFQFLDSLSYSRGRNTFKVGFSVISREVDFVQGNDAKGYFWIDDNNCGPSCGGLPWAYSGLGTFTGSQVSELEAGFMGGYELGNLSGYYKTKNWETGYFAQDDVRVTRKLTLNLGLRYDLYTWPYELNNHQSNFDPTTGTLVEAGTSGWNRALVNTDTNNFAPRIGFAYDLFGSGRSVIRGGYGMFYYLDRGGVGNQLSNNPDFNGLSAYYACPTETTCSTGYRITLSGAAAPGSTNPVGATGALPAPGGTIDPANLTSAANVIYYPKNSPNSSVQQWNLQFEHQLNTNTALDIGYVGTKMDHLSTVFNANSPAIGTNVKWFPNVGNITEYGDIGTGTYNGLQVSLKRNMTRGLQYTVAYTWSHTLDNSNGAFSPSTGGGGIVVGDNGDPLLYLNKGNADNDIRHALVASAIYELPWGKGRRWMNNAPKAVEYVLGGWQWNNIVTLMSGAPMNVYLNNRLYTTYNGGCTYNGPDKHWLDCPAGAFTYQDGVFGNLARNYFRGPGTHVWDSSLFKTIPITERFNTELRLQAYNLTNTPQFQNPDANFGNGDFGQETATRLASERRVEIAVRVTF